MRKLQKIWNSQKNEKNMKHIYHTQYFFLLWYIWCGLLIFSLPFLETGGFTKITFAIKIFVFEIFKRETIFGKMFFLVRKYHKLSTFQLSRGRTKKMTEVYLSCNNSPLQWNVDFESDRPTKVLTLLISQDLTIVGTPPPLAFIKGNQNFWNFLKKGGCSEFPNEGLFWKREKVILTECPCILKFLKTPEKQNSKKKQKNCSISFKHLLNFPKVCKKGSGPMNLSKMWSWFLFWMHSGTELYDSRLDLVLLNLINRYMTSTNE